MSRRGKTDRVLGVALAALGLAAIVGAAAIQVPFLSDPVGPKPFPMAAGAVLVVCGILVALRPGESVEWPSIARLGAIAAAAGALILYAVGMRPLGFVLATALAVSVAAKVFGARLIQAVPLGLGCGAVLFWLFDRVFEIPLPLGLLAPVLR